MVMEWKPSTTWTPWGKAECSRKIIPGVVEYETPGHGGIHVSEKLCNLLSEYTKKEATFESRGRGMWFEEDCAYSLPVIELSKYFQFDSRTIDGAIRCAKMWYPNFMEVAAE